MLPPVVVAQLEDHGDLPAPEAPSLPPPRPAAPPLQFDRLPGPPT